MEYKLDSPNLFSSRRSEYRVWKLDGIGVTIVLSASLYDDMFDIIQSRGIVKRIERYSWWLLSHLFNHIRRGYPTIHGNLDTMMSLCCYYKQSLADSGVSEINISQIVNERETNSVKLFGKGIQKLKITSRSRVSILLARLSKKRTTSLVVK